MNNQVVLFSIIEATNGKKIGIASLNNPSTLNSLSLEMVNLLIPKFKEWQQDDDVVAVVLTAEGEKSFCAGGDLQVIYQSMQEFSGENKTKNPVVREYFKLEYTLDYIIHTYTKPIICLTNGIVMGGGMGLLQACSHRVINSKARFAMPEVTISLFPDVGGSWWLNHLPGNLGRFLAASGAVIYSDDILYSDMADFQMERADWDKLYSEFKTIDWSDNRYINDDLITATLNKIAQTQPQAEGPLQKNIHFINELANTRDYKTLYHRIAKLENHEDEWLQKAAQTMLKGSVLSVGLAIELQNRVRFESLAKAFQIEYAAVLHCCFNGHFQEGIRALLIEKDRNPQWEITSIDKLSREHVHSYFEPLWEGPCPLQL